MNPFRRLIQNPLLRTVIATRRALRGPRRPTWTLDMEVACEVLRLYAPLSRRMSPLAMRAGLNRMMRGVCPERVREERGRIGELSASWFVPEEETHDAVLYYLHGGGYVLGSVQSHANLIGSLCRSTGCRAIALDYRLAPEHGFPGAIEDAVAGYRYVLAQGIAPRRIVLMGDSAGGGLCMSLMLRLRALHLPQPAAAVLFSPWVDLENRGSTMRNDPKCDYITRDYLDLCAHHLLDRTSPSHPLVSSIHADLSGLPPLLLQAGGEETLLDDAVRLYAVARDAGVDVTLDVYPDMVHVFQVFDDFAPEAQRAIKKAAEFVRDRAGTPHRFSAVAQ